MAETPTLCPECGVSMADRDPVGHALAHWPEHIPLTADTLQARQRKAALLGQPLPER